MEGIWEPGVVIETLIDTEGRGQVETAKNAKQVRRNMVVFKTKVALLRGRVLLAWMAGAYPELGEVGSSGWGSEREDITITPVHP